MTDDIGQHMQVMQALEAGTLRAASVRIADQIASEHPHPLDDRYPQLAGAAIAKDPAVRHGLSELLDLLGISHRNARRENR